MEKELRYLAFQGGSRHASDPFSQSLADLQIRANYIRSVQQNPDTYIDPVLRFHLGLPAIASATEGLDPVKPKEPRK